MQPKRPTLARTIQSAARILRSISDRPEALSLIEVIDTCANELLLRWESEFFIQHEAKGRSLIQLGRSLAGNEPGEAGPKKAPSAGEALDEAIGETTAELERLVHRIGPSGDRDSLDFFRRVHAWENGLYAHRLDTALNNGTASHGHDRLNRETIRGYLRRRLPDASDIEITDFRILPGGFSKVTILCDTIDRVHGAQSFVVRAEPDAKFMELEGMDLRNEFPVVQIAHRAGIPVAAPILLEEDASIIGMRFTINRKAAGQVFGTVKDMNGPLDDAMVRKLARLLAGIHAVPIDSADPLVAGSHLAHWTTHPDLRANTLAFVNYWSNQMAINHVAPSPMITRTMDWLRANAPEDEARPCLLHGDYGLHNLMIENGDVTALLDWENSRIGDPAEEIAHLFASLSGKVEQDAFLRYYIESGGQPISPFRLRYFDVVDGFNVALACMATLTRLDNFSNPNIYWSVFGLKFGYHYTDRLERAIATAEKARDTALAA